MSENCILNKSIVKKYNATRLTHNKKYICNAPFTSLRFNIYGEILACCYNKTIVWGSYPEDSIMSVWTGENAKKLRRRVAKNDLALGCHLCHASIMNHSFFSVKSRLYDHLKPLKKQPVLLEFELDNTCNLECIMCNGEASSMIRKNENNKPVFEKKYDKTFLEQLKPILPKIQQANFIGGEPFMIPMYFVIMEEIIRVNSKAIINISTNGTVLNDRIKKILNAGNFDISVSIDSLDKETYELIRKNADFEKTFSNLHYFYDYCQKKNRFFTIWVCPLKINRYEIPKIFDFFNKMNVPVYLNNVINPQELIIANLEENELINLQSYYKTYIFTTNTITSSENYNRFMDFVNQLDLWIQNVKYLNLMLRSFENIEQIKLLILNKIEKYYNTKYHNNYNQSFFNTQRKINKIFLILNDINSSKEVLLYFLNSGFEEFIQTLELHTEEFLCDYVYSNLIKKNE